MAATNNHRIKTKFYADYFTEFSEDVQNSEGPIVSEDIDILVLLCIMCYDFKTERKDEDKPKDYQQKFFRLLKSDNALGTGIYRSSSSRQRKIVGAESRICPRYSRGKPASSPGFEFIWPAFRCDDGTDKAFIWIPSHYWSEECREQSISLSCILYLLLADVAPAFSNFADPSSSSQSPEKLQIECPCLMEYFHLSPLTNQNNFKALLSEYVALLQICFKENYCDNCSCEHEVNAQAQQHLFKPKTSDVLKTSDGAIPVNSDDFYVKQCSNIRNFSVKTYNHVAVLSFFCHEASSSANTDFSACQTPKKKKKASDCNIIVLNCCCGHCLSNATVLLEEAGNEDERCPRNTAHEFVRDIFENVEQGRHFITSAWRLFQLRFALQGFEHKVFWEPSKDDPPPKKKKETYRFCSLVTNQFKTAVQRVFGTIDTRNLEKPCLKLIVQAQ